MKSSGTRPTYLFISPSLFLSALRPAHASSHPHVRCSQFLRGARTLRYGGASVNNGQINRLPKEHHRVNRQYHQVTTIIPIQASSSSSSSSESLPSESSTSPTADSESKPATTSPVAANALPEPVPFQSNDTQPVFSPRPPFEGALSSPVIHRYLWDDGEQYVMWYTSRPSLWENAGRVPRGTLSGEIRMALSADGVNWERVKGPLKNECILTVNDDDWWAFDTTHIATGSVTLSHGTRVRSDGGVYLMYYSGGDKERMPVSEEVKVNGGRTRIGVALSKDGEHFTRIEGEFPSAAVLDVADPPAFDDLFVAGPCVVRDEDKGEYVMYYHGATARDRRLGIGRAVSQDAFAFQRAPTRRAVVSAAGSDVEEWMERGVCRPCVRRRRRRTGRGGEWVMWLEVVGGDGVHRIAMCESGDGVEWSRPRVVLDVGERGEWDAAGVSHPCAVVVEEGGRAAEEGDRGDEVRVYYVGKREDHDVDAGRGTNIGVAVSVGGDWGKMRRLTKEEVESSHQGES